MLRPGALFSTGDSCLGLGHVVGIMSSRRAGLVAILCLGLAYAVPIPDGGWNQGAHFAIVRAIWRGSAPIDQDRWLTSDVAYVGGHYYAAKAPGLALSSLPVYAVMRTTGLSKAIDRHTDSRATAAGLTMWSLGLLSVAGAAVILLLLVRSVGDRVERGYGLAAATTMGVGTLVLPFATLYFAHVLSTLFAFAGFALLWRERDSSPRPALIVASGVLTGLAITTEFTVALVAGPLLVYALLCPVQRVRRGLGYAAGVVVGIVPLLAFNWWAFGSPFHIPYSNAVSVPGSSGHDVLEANASGIFGVGWPSARVVGEIVIGSRGLLTLSPVLVMSAVGTILVYRRGRRAEALTISTVTLLFIVMDAGYYLPFGGDTPGPRF